MNRRHKLLLALGCATPFVFLVLSHTISPLDTPTHWRLAAVLRFVVCLLLLAYVSFLLVRVVAGRTDSSWTMPRWARYFLVPVLGLLALVLVFVGVVPYGGSIFDTPQNYQGVCSVVSNRVETSHRVSREYNLRIPGYRQDFSISSYTYHQLTDGQTSDQLLPCRHEIRLQYVPASATILELQLR